jgi:pilus assembly protein CpaC
VLEALERNGTVRTLAEPNLVALSGDKASFLAGGEFPFPVASDDNKITIEFKKFGVGLVFTPTVLADKLINVKIEPEVSQLDTTRTLRLADIEIPSLTVRRANTTVELRDGQSFAIAGLLQTTNAKTLAQLPWIGDVPVLGALFRSASYQRSETDLVIIVTPRLVRPTDAPVKLVTPLDDRLPGNDADFFLGGKAEIPKNVLEIIRSPEIGRATTGHIVE